MLTSGSEEGIVTATDDASSLPTQDKNLWLGIAKIDPPGTVVAGTYGTWTVEYVVGKYGIDNSGSVKVAIRMTCDWQNPQVTDPSADGYTTVTNAGDAKVRARFDQRGGERPWNRVLLLDVYDGSLA